MRRREFLTTLGASVLAARSATAARAKPKPEAGADTAPPGPRPDVLLILADQWNPRCGGFAGDRAAPTAHLDRLAADGIVFENHYTPCPVCMPARCSLLTGLYPHNTALWGNNNDYTLPPESGTMFQDLRRAGYTTAQIGKLHWNSGRGWRRNFDSLDNYYRALGLDHCEELPSPFSTPEGHGPYQDRLRQLGLLDAYCRDMAERVEKGQYLARPSVVLPEDHNDSFVADRAIEFLRNQPADKPYCLVTSFFGPHPPIDAPGRYATLVAPETLELPPNVPERFNYHDAKFDHAELRRVRANYFGKMALIDDNIGRLIETLRRRGTWDNTLVIFSADHGEMLGAHGTFSKGRFYEESGRVPLLMRWPGRIPSGRRAKALSNLIDLYATIVEAAGGKVSPDRFTRSLLGVAAGTADSARDTVFAEIGHQRYLNYLVRTPQFAWWQHNGRQSLFDMDNDPYQVRNLIDSPEHRDALAEIRQRHLEYFQTTQVNLSAGYKNMMERMTEQGGGRGKGLSDRLYEKFREGQQSPSDRQK